MSCPPWSISGILIFRNCFEGYGSLGGCIESVWVFLEEGVSYFTVQQSIDERVLISFLPSCCVQVSVCCFAQFSNSSREFLNALPFILLEVLELGSCTSCIRKISNSIVKCIENPLDRRYRLSLYLNKVLIWKVVVLVQCVVVQASGENCSLPGIVPVVRLSHRFEMAYPSLEAVEVFARIT